MAQVFDVAVDPEDLIARLPVAVASHPRSLGTLMAHLRDLPLELLLAEGAPEDARAPARLIEQALRSVDDRDRFVLALAEVLSGTSLANTIPLLGMPFPEGFAGSLRLLVGRSLIQLNGGVADVPALVGEALSAVDSSSRDETSETVTAALVASFGRIEDAGTDPAELAEVAAHVGTNLTVARRWPSVAPLIREQVLDVLNRRGYWKEYSVLLRAGIDAAAALGDRHAQVVLGCRLARKLPQMGDLPGAHAVLSSVEAVASEGDDDERAEVYSHQALLHDLDGDDEAALRDLAKSRAIRQARGDREKLLVVEKLIGNILMRRKEYPAARVAYEAALAIPDVNPDGKDRLDAIVGLARCDLAEDRPEDAEERLRSVIYRMEAIQYDAGLPRGQLTLALTLERLGKNDEAMRLARRAAEAKRTDPDVTRAADMLAWRLSGGPDTDNSAPVEDRR
jgi:tetratricopeptide (TPR) repeat protein